MYLVADWLSCSGGAFLRLLMVLGVNNWFLDILRVSRRHGDDAVVVAVGNVNAEATSDW